MLRKIYDNMYIVGDTRTLFIDGVNALVFADLHLGFEEDMARNGYFIPRAQLSRAMKFINKAFSIVDSIDTIIIDGDLKHAFDKLLRQERYEVKKFLDYLINEKNIKEIIIIRGNHDNYIPIILKDYNIGLHITYDLNVGDQKILLTHGHLDIDIGGYDAIIIGHEHPSIGIVDELGLLTKVHCYLKTPTTSETYIIVLPALGAYQAGNTISLDRDNYLSPIMRKYGLIEETIPIAVIEDTGVLELPRLGILFMREQMVS